MYWLTQIEAKDPETGEMHLWAGPRVWADTEEQAHLYCQLNGLGYCKIIGKHIEDIPYQEDVIWLN